jgi:DNA-binding IclR family transcriptional regulator
VLLAGKLEAMLRASEGGLSARAIAARANAAPKQVLDLLRELEQSGQVRRTGSRRTSRWQLITDEQRIAERVAELERLRRAQPAAAA